MNRTMQIIIAILSGIIVVTFVVYALIVYVRTGGF